MSENYTKTAIALHWIIGVAIIIMLVMGLVMEDVPDTMKPFVYMMHKSVGLTILVLSFVRLGWRLMHTAPALPSTMKSWEVAVSKITHGAFYLLMIGIPLSGWALVSSAPAPYDYPVMWFNLFQWPTLPFERAKETVESFAEIHEVLANLTIALLLLHVGGALKHHFVEKDNVLARMLPFLKK